MKRKQKVGETGKGAGRVRAFALLMTGAALLAGCATTEPVREYSTIQEGVEVQPDACQARTERSLEPVGEAYTVRPWNRRVVVTGADDAYYNPMTRGFERPWPYGPYDTANWR